MNLVTGDITRYLISEEDKTYSNSVIEELMIDSSGELWACSISGINYYDRKNDKFITIPTDLFKKAILQDFVEDDQGNIWISTDLGLYRYNPINKNIEEFNDPKNIIGKKDIFSMLYEDGKLWLGTKTDGLLIMDLKDYSIKSYRHNPNDSTTIPSNFIRDMLIAKDNTIWLGTDQGLVLFDEEEEKFYNYQNSTKRYSLSDNNIVSLFQDKLGVIWVGTFSGISKFSINREFKVYRNDPLNDNSLSNSSVCGIYEDDDEMVWVGTFNSGVNRINKKTGEITRYYNSVNDSQTLSSNRIKDITGIENEIWIATDNGLNKYDKDTEKFTVYKKTDDENSVVNSEIRVLYIDREDFKIEPPRKYFRLYPGNEVRLMNAYFVTCTDYVTDEDGNVTEVHCTYDPETKSGSGFNARKVKGTIHWVCAETAEKCEIRLYENIVDEEKGVYNEDGSINVNPNSLTVLDDCYVEPALAEAEALDSFQFVRHGYFCVDSKDSTKEHMVFNRIVSLKSSYKPK